VTPERGVHDAIHQQQARPLVLRDRRERLGRVVVGDALDRDRETGALDAGGDVDGMHPPAHRRAWADGVRLGHEVGGAGLVVDGGRAGDAHLRHQVAAGHVLRVPRRAHVARPANSAVDRVDAVDPVRLGGDEDEIVDDQWLRVDLADDGCAEQLAERAAAHQRRCQRGLIGIPAVASRVAGVGDDRGGRRAGAGLHCHDRHRQECGRKVPGHDRLVAHGASPG